MHTLHTGKRAFLLIVLISVILQQNGYAQNYQPNFGLRQPQDPATLPVSKAPRPVTVRKAKVNLSAELQRVTDNEYLLNSGWEMAPADMVTAAENSIFNASFNTSGWFNATVPGTVLTTLVEQGVYPDPYFGLNNLYIPDSLCRKQWWYRLELPLPETIAGKNVWLVFNGINYKADIWLNGKLLGRMAGAFTRGNFDATPLISSTGKNILAVHIYPPHNPGIPHEESSKTNHGPNGGQLSLDGPTFISSEGWDWIPGIRDRNIGIWQDVRLRITNAITISDPQVTTDLNLPDTTRATVTIKALVKNHSGIQQQVTVSGKIESLEFSKNIRMQPGESAQIVFTSDEFSQLNIKNPRLWWPNGYGRAELYTLHLSAGTGQDVSDLSSVRFGIRELSYELSLAQPEKKMKRVEFNPIKAGAKVIFNNIDRVDAGKGTVLPQLVDPNDMALLTPLDNESQNPFLTIKVNGVPIFCKGGNWGMDDGMKRVSRERLEPYFRLHRDANYNMVRNWTGESTEELFYELSDEYGMLVWNDFWLSTEGYNLDVNDNDLFMANATDVVKRFRNHPSIAIWCPRNEGYAPAQLEPRLAELIATEDGTRHYAPNSRNLNLRPSGPWHYLKDAGEYYRNHAEGFSTELGTPSVPTAATMRSFIPAEDQWPVSDTWYYHDLHDGQKDYIHAMESRYGKTTGLDDFCKKAQ
jgi:beta-galactosidase/beta-glucuronidase